MAAFAIGVLTTVTLVVAKPWDGPGVARALPTPVGLAPTASPSTTQGTPQPVVWSPMEDRQAWLLDFDRSGLSAFVCLAWEGTSCESEGHLGSSIRFKGDQVVGGTGDGGGCDQFTGSVEVEEDLGLIAIRIPTYESRCYDTGVDREIRDRLNRVASWHFEDRLLILVDSDETQLLVYRPGG